MTYDAFQSYFEPYRRVSQENNGNNGYIIPPENLTPKHTPMHLNPEQQAAAEEMIRREGYFNPDKLDTYVEFNNKYRQDTGNPPTNWLRDIFVGGPTGGASNMSTQYVVAPSNNFNQDVANISWRRLNQPRSFLDNLVYTLSGGRNRDNYAYKVFSDRAKQEGR